MTRALVGSVIHMMGGETLLPSRTSPPLCVRRYACARAMLCGAPAYGAREWRKGRSRQCLGAGDRRRGASGGGVDSLDEALQMRSEDRAKTLLRAEGRLRMHEALRSPVK